MSCVHNAAALSGSLTHDSMHTCCHLLPPALPQQISTLAALAYHKSTGRTAARPNQRLGFAENFLYMLDRWAWLQREGEGGASACA